MADATTAARLRIDRALAALERKVNELKLRSTTVRPPDDDDLFAIPATEAGSGAALQGRIAELEAAGKDASNALGRAIDELRAAMLREDGDPPIDDTLDEED